jgi:uncharacterized protein YcsI (UPF0317 family)
MAPTLTNNPIPFPAIDSTPATPQTGLSVRLAARESQYVSPTSGLAPTFLQANLIVLPSRYAAEFRLFCCRNPVPCPLLAESKSIGSWNELKSWIQNIPDESIAADIDIRRDAPKYMVYENGKLSKFQCDDIILEWTQDHVAFLIGCSYSFESALAVANLPPRHTVMDRNVPMYRTNIRLCPAGVFSGASFVVSMRPYSKSEIESVRDLTRPYVATHGEPIAWGWDAVTALGIENLDTPEWGESPMTLDSEPLTSVFGDDENIPVFWGCGVTPQEAVIKAKLQGTVMAHAPGHMLVLDLRDWDVLEHH